MQLRPQYSLIAALAAIGLNFVPGIAQADFDRTMTEPATTQSRVLAAEITAFRDGAESIRPLSEEINLRVDEIQVSSGAWKAYLSAHEDRLSAARSEGKIVSMTEPGHLVEARLDGMIIAYELIDIQGRFNPGREPAPIAARSLPGPNVLKMLVDERMGLPSGEASLAGYERMMSAWSDLGSNPALAPIRTPGQEARALDILEEAPEMARFLPADFISLSAQERADRIRTLVSENPGLEKFVHGSILEGSDLTLERSAKAVAGLSPDQLTRLSTMVDEYPRARRFLPEETLAEIDASQRNGADETLSKNHIKLEMIRLRIHALSGEGPVRDPFSAPEVSGPDLE